MQKVNAASINRNIVECKGAVLRYHQCYGAVLIETLWNVKLSPSVSSASAVRVLIETLWNVKRSRQDFPKSTSFFVLIETLWNVKSVAGYFNLLLLYGY